MEFTIECKKRTEGSKARAMRREGLLPATLYGHNGAESISLTMSKKDAETLVKKASVNNTLVQLKVTDIPWNGKALIREVQAHPWKGYLYHLSFFSVAAQDSLEVKVPVSFVGVAPGVVEGGVLDSIFSELQVKCAPDSIPDVIEVDVSNLQVGESLYINQLVLPDGVTVLNDGEQALVTITAAVDNKVEEEAEAAAEQAVTEETV